jgi:hypothetical protein
MELDRRIAKWAKELRQTYFGYPSGGVGVGLVGMLT